MPLILDNILVFLFRAIVLIYLDIRSRDWPVIEGVITRTDADIHTMYPLTRIFYSYTLEGIEYFGTYKHGFWFSYSAQRFASFYPLSKMVRVRYNPAQHHISFLEDNQQYDEEPKSRK
jgi:hypothetical protein